MRPPHAAAGLPAPERLTAVQSVAFFDVDETLITAKSMLDFVQHTPQDGPAPTAGRGKERRPEVLDLAELHRRGASRAEMNRAYYRRYAGVPLTEFQAAGHAWYRAYRSRAEGFVTAGLQALERHRQAGCGIVLVSGSARSLLEPIAKDLGADLVLCTEQFVDAEGLLTGEVARPMIGEAKAEAAATVMRRLGIAPVDCFAYGDHASDFDMLHTVGNPVVVGADPVLLGHARAAGWPVLPSDPGPRHALKTTRTDRATP